MMIEDIFRDDLVDDVEEMIEEGEELRRDSDGGSDDENKKKDEEDKEKEKPKIRKTMGPRPVLNAQRLTGPRGIATMEDFFSGIKLDGRRGNEEKDLDVILKRLELWTHRLYPRGQFDDCLKKIEKLGTNKVVRNCITRIRLGMEDGCGQSDLILDEPNSPPQVTSTEDPFDQLISSTTGPAAANGSNTEMTTEQRERMLRNRLIAEERRAARIKKAQELKEKFKKAQEASDSQHLVSIVEQGRNITEDEQLEESNGPLPMEVDDSADSVGITITTNQSAVIEKRDDTDKGLVENEIREGDSINNGISNTLTNFGDLTDDAGKGSRDQECLSINMLIDDPDPNICSSQEKWIGEESIDKNNGKENGEKVIDGEETVPKESLTTENLTKEEVKLNHEDVAMESPSKANGEELTRIQNQAEIGNNPNHHEKENENPNPHSN